MHFGFIIIPISQPYGMEVRVRRILERREFLRAALEQCSASAERENLLRCIDCLTEEDAVMGEGGDVARQGRSRGAALWFRVPNWVSLRPTRPTMIN